MLAARVLRKCKSDVRTGETFTDKDHYYYLFTDLSLEFLGKHDPSPHA